MTDDKGYDWDNRWGVGFGLGEKEHYYNYFWPYGLNGGCLDPPSWIPGFSPNLRKLVER